MKYRLLGHSGLRVSELALGTMTFGDDWGWGSPKDEARKIYDAYREAGGNFIDTANFYTAGQASASSESSLPRTVRKWLWRQNTAMLFRGRMRTQAATSARIWFRP